MRGNTFLSYSAVNLGDISPRSRILDVEKISVPNLGGKYRTDILGDIGRYWTIFCRDFAIGSRYMLVLAWMERCVDIERLGLVMEAPLSPDRVFDFPMVEPEQHHAYDFFTAEPIPGIAEASGGAEEAGLDLLFGDDTDDDDDEDDWESDDEWLMTPVTPPRATVTFSSTYEVGGPSTTTSGTLPVGQPFPGMTRRTSMLPSVVDDLCVRMGNLEYGHGALVKKMGTVGDAQVADSIAVGEIWPRVTTVEGQVQVMALQAGWRRLILRFDPTVFQAPPPTSLLINAIIFLEIIILASLLSSLIIRLPTPLRINSGVPHRTSLAPHPIILLPRKTIFEARNCATNLRKNAKFLLECRFDSSYHQLSN
ncbi:hypothetical protein Tco_0132954 [Tanacetum coccineum]